MIYSLGDMRLTTVSDDYYVAANASLIGAINLGNNSSIWWNAVALRYPIKRHSSLSCNPRTTMVAAKNFFKQQGAPVGRGSAMGGHTDNGTAGLVRVSKILFAS